MYYFSCTFINELPCDMCSPVGNLKNCQVSWEVLSTAFFYCHLCRLVQSRVPLPFPSSIRFSSLLETIKVSHCMVRSVHKHFPD